MTELHLTSDESAWLEAYRRSLRQRHAGSVVGMLVYGSKARGESHAESDVDVLIIVRNDAAHLKRTLRGIGYELAATSDAVPSIMAYTLTEWQERKARGRSNVRLNATACLSRESSPCAERVVARGSDAPRGTASRPGRLSRGCSVASLLRGSICCEGRVVGLRRAHMESHAGTRRMFGKHLIPSRAVEREWAKYLGESMDDRLAADYDIGTSYSLEQAQEECGRAEGFLGRIRRCLLDNGLTELELATNEETG